MPDLSELSFEDYGKAVAQLKKTVLDLKITDEATYKQAQKESQAYTACRLEILKLIDGLDYAIKTTNEKLLSWERKPATQKIPPKQEAKKEQPKPTLFDDFDNEPLSEQDDMALEMKKSLDLLF